VTARNVTGEMRARTEHGSVEASDVTGAVVIQSSFDGVVLERIAGPVEVTVEHGGLRASGLEKGAKARVTGDEAVFDGFHGPMEVTVERAGGIELIPGAALTDAVSATAVHGAIRLEVPRDSHIDLEAAAPGGGEVQVDVPGLVISRDAAGRASGRLGGGGNTVRLVAEHGDVHVEAPPAVAAKNP